MRQRAVSINRGELRLEGVVGCPDEVSGPAPGVVICHPGPAGGGNMNNNLVLSLYFALIDNGFIALRFNFRGVGSSQGIHSQGEKEPEDAAAALELLAASPDVDRDRIGMPGYSFGTGVILCGLSRYKAVKAFVLYSSPVRFLECPGLSEDDRPKQFICGDRDYAVEIASLKEKVASLGHSSECRVVSDVDHFWMGHEAEASRLAVDFFNKTLGT